MRPVAIILCISSLACEPVERSKDHTRSFLVDASSLECGGCVFLGLDVIDVKKEGLYCTASGSCWERSWTALPLEGAVLKPENIRRFSVDSVGFEIFDLPVIGLTCRQGRYGTSCWKTKVP